MPINLEAFRFVNRGTVIAAVVASCLLYAAMFAVPKRVNFSYATPTCTGAITLLPALHRGVGGGKFTLEYRGGTSIANVALVSTRTCFVPSAAPAKGLVRAASAPFGGA